MYWILVAESNRRNCLHSISCSKHVYNVTDKNGLIKGLRALSRRIKTCRPGSEVIWLHEENTVLLKLANGTILNEKEISVDILKNYKAVWKN